MNNSPRKIKSLRFVAGIMFAVCGFLSASAQSSNQNYPTAVTSAEIAGKIAARDIGDARLTSYFYTFNGTQGDIFINIETANLDGDVDVFLADNLRPLTKIRVFSDAAATETGRVIYLRKPEKLILRIEGRSPNEQPATFTLKFAGTFAPAPASAPSDLPELPEIKITGEGGARVNSVGTIIEEAKPKNVEPETTKNQPNRRIAQTTAVGGADETTPKTPAPSKKDAKRRRDTNKTPTVKPDEEVAEQNAEKTDDSEKNSESTIADAAPKKNVKPKTPKTRKKPPETKPAEPNPLENVRLVIELKDGTKIERPMSEVLRVGVDKGVLTLITKNGAIARYPILDVAKMTIE